MAFRKMQARPATVSLRANDQFAALCLVSHPRCGMSHNRIPSSEALGAVKIVWEMVKDTRRRFTIEPFCFANNVAWPINFEMSPLVLGTFGGPPVITPENDGTGANSGTRYTVWVDSTHRLEPPPSTSLRDLATGAKVPLFPRVLPPHDADVLHAYAVNHAWFVASAFESDVTEGNMLGLSIGRLSDEDPAATSVVVRLEYSAVSHRVDTVIFNKSVVNELLVVVRDRSSNAGCVFVVIDVQSSFESKSLCVLSETRLDVGKCYIVGNATIMMYGGGSRCFIGLVTNDDGTGYCILVFENNPQVFILWSTKMVYRMSRLSAHLFAVSYLREREDEFGIPSCLCEIWDCNNFGGPLLVLPLTENGQLCYPLVESGVLFYIQDSELIVKEPLTGFTVLRVALPSAPDHQLGYPFCFS
ncbi:hypothetical protein Pelo_5917 [Pelomyxa schiedti]|nr:hypothetical protein Pelo_5917 [Pelomyxa schiedti]